MAQLPSHRKRQFEWLLYDWECTDPHSNQPDVYDPWPLGECICTCVGIPHGAWDLWGNTAPWFGDDQELNPAMAHHLLFCSNKDLINYYHQPPWQNFEVAVDCESHEECVNNPDYNCHNFCSVPPGGDFPCNPKAHDEYYFE